MRSKKDYQLIRIGNKIGELLDKPRPYKKSYGLVMLKRKPIDYKKIYGLQVRIPIRILMP